MSSLRSKIAYWFIDAFVPTVFPRLNPIARRLLKSRAHILVSWYVVVLCFEGRRTRRHYEVLENDDVAITKILASRDRCRKMLMPIRHTVVLRVHFKDGSQA